MKLHHALTALLVLGVNLTSLSDPAQAQRGSRGKAPQRRNAAAQTRGAAEQRRHPLAELGLTAEQQAQIEALHQARRAQMTPGQRPSPEEMAALREAHRAQLQSILTAEQFEKLEAFQANRPAIQRFARQEGLRAGPRPFAGLELTEAQQAQLAEIRQEMQARMQAFRESGQRPSPEEMAEIRAHREAFENILTDEQRALLAERRKAAVSAQTDAAAKAAGTSTEESSWGQIKEQMK